MRRITCPQCNGIGLIRIEKGPRIYSRVCPYCAGWGKLTPITHDSKTAAAGETTNP